MTWIDLVPLEACVPRFPSDLRLEPGLVVKFEDGKKILVGHVNSLGGICDHCPAEYLKGRGPKIVALGRIENLNRKETADNGEAT